MTSETKIKLQIAGLLAAMVPFSWFVILAVMWVCR